MSTVARLDAILGAAARTHGGRVAIESSSGETLSYGDLAERAAAIAGVLARRGVRPGDRVGLFAGKSPDLVAALWGVLVAGAAYVPADPLSPASRAAGVFRDAGVRLALGAAGAAEALGGERLGALPASSLEIVTLPAAASPPPGVNPALAYVLYTSGSTGTPKGVAHSHASATSFVDWSARTFPIGPEDRVASIAPFHFDLSVFDLFASAAVGARLVLVEEALARSPRALAAFAATARLSVWYSTPTTIRLLVEHGRGDAAPGPRLVLFAGEPFPPAALRRAREHWSGGRWFNLYGPTETNVCTFHEVAADASFESPPPIGRPCPYALVRVVDEEGRDVARGQVGELRVAGASLMEGYWERPAENARALVHDASGVRWYRTGDRVRERDDGELVFLGRADRMVKRRGFRVELGEIEARLFDHPAVLEAAVLALPDDEQGVRLVACLRAAERLSPLDLKSHCARSLPPYMVPDRFVAVAEIPRTPSDKIDYRGLAALL